MALQWFPGTMIPWIPGGQLSPPSSSAPSGSTPSGSTPSGSTPSGSTPSGSTPSGSTPSGSTSSGSTPSGSSSYGPETVARLYEELAKEGKISEEEASRVRTEAYHSEAKVLSGQAPSREDYLRAQEYAAQYQFQQKADEGYKPTIERPWIPGAQLSPPSPDSVDVFYSPQLQAYASQLNEETLKSITEKARQHAINYGRAMGKSYDVVLDYGAHTNWRPDVVLIGDIDTGGRAIPGIGGGIFASFTPDKDDKSLMTVSWEEKTADTPSTLEPSPQYEFTSFTTTAPSGKQIEMRYDPGTGKYYDPVGMGYDIRPTDSGMMHLVPEQGDWRNYMDELTKEGIRSIHRDGKLEYHAGGRIRDSPALSEAFDKLIAHDTMLQNILAVRKLEETPVKGEHKMEVLGIDLAPAIQSVMPSYEMPAPEYNVDAEMAGIALPNIVLPWNTPTEELQKHDLYEAKLISQQEVRDRVEAMKRFAQLSRHGPAGLAQLSKEDIKTLSSPITVFPSEWAQKDFSFKTTPIKPDVTGEGEFERKSRVLAEERLALPDKTVGFDIIPHHYKITDDEEFKNIMIETGKVQDWWNKLAEDMSSPFIETAENIYDLPKGQSYEVPFRIATIPVTVPLMFAGTAVETVVKAPGVMIGNIPRASVSLDIGIKTGSAGHIIQTGIESAEPAFYTLPLIAPSASGTKSVAGVAATKLAPAAKKTGLSLSHYMMGGILLLGGAGEVAATGDPLRFPLGSAKTAGHIVGYMLPGTAVRSVGMWAGEQIVSKALDIKLAKGEHLTMKQIESHLLYQEKGRPSPMIVKEDITGSREAIKAYEWEKAQTHKLMEAFKHDKVFRAQLSKLPEGSPERQAYIAWRTGRTIDPLLHKSTYRIDPFVSDPTYMPRIETIQAQLTQRVLKPELGWLTHLGIKPKVPGTATIYSRTIGPASDITGYEGMLTPYLSRPGKAEMLKIDFFTGKSYKSVYEGFYTPITIGPNVQAVSESFTTLAQFYITISPSRQKIGMLDYFTGSSEFFSPVGTSLITEQGKIIGHSITPSLTQLISAPASVKLGIVSAAKPFVSETAPYSKSWVFRASPTKGTYPSDAAEQVTYLYHYGTAKTWLGDKYLGKSEIRYFGAEPKLSMTGDAGLGMERGSDILTGMGKGISIPTGKSGAQLLTQIGKQTTGEAVSAVKTDLLTKTLPKMDVVGGGTVTRMITLSIPISQISELTKSLAPVRIAPPIVKPRVEPRIITPPRTLFGETRQVAPIITQLTKYESATLILAPSYPSYKTYTTYITTPGKPYIPPGANYFIEIMPPPSIPLIKTPDYLGGTPRRGPAPISILGMHYTRQPTLTKTALGVDIPVSRALLGTSFDPRIGVRSQFDKPSALFAPAMRTKPARGRPRKRPLEIKRRPIIAPKRKRIEKFIF